MNLAVLVPLPVLIPLIGAGLTLMLAGRVRMQNAVTIAALTIALIVEVLMLFNVDANGTQVVAVGGWELPFGIALVVDRLSALMLVVSSLVTLSVLIYAIGQDMSGTNHDSPVSVFNPAYLILCAGVSNAFIAGDLFNLYVGFEMLLAASYVLLTLGSTPERIRVGATYIVVSLLSSLIFLSAIGLIYGATGTVNMAQLSLRLDALPADIQMFLHIALLLGFGIKAAVFPLSFWLPDSYPTAPAPVTAVFAGLLTKVGIYAIIRTETLLFFQSSLRVPLLIVAALTMLVGILGAIAQTEIKRMLSFTLVSHIGYLLFGVAMGTVEGVTAAVFYTVHHIIVQAALFLAVGLVEQRTGSTSTRRLGGLATLTPLMAGLYFIPALNLGGIPPFSGFIGKVALFESGLGTGEWLNLVTVLAGTLTSLLTLYVVTRTWNLAFWRDPEDAEEPTAELVEQFDDFKEARAAGRPKPRIQPLPRTMVGPTIALVAVSVGLTVFAGPLWGLSERAGENLRNPSNYVTSVLGPGAARLADSVADEAEGTDGSPDAGDPEAGGTGTDEPGTGGAGDRVANDVGTTEGSADR